MDKRSRVWLFAVLLIALLPARAAAQPPTPLHVGLLSRPESIDPAWAQDGAGRLLVDQLFLGLVRVGENGEVLPELARGWEAAGDGYIWTFYLRQDVVWVDAYGDPQAGVYAGDVIGSIERAREIARSPGNLQIIEAMEALDDYTVRFYLDEPAGYFPALLTLPVFRPVPVEIADTGNDSWTTPERIWTNGPYLLGGWNGAVIQLERNPHWWGAGQVHFEQVQITAGLDAWEGLDRYQGGEFDLVELSEDAHSRVREDGSLAPELHTPLSAPTAHFGFVTSREPFDNLFVRQAFARTVDREKLCEPFGLGTPTTRFVPPGVFGSTTGPRLDFDPDLAQELLAQAGYPGAEGFPVVSLFYPTGSSRLRQMVEAAVADWEARLGVRIEISELPVERFRLAVRPDTSQETPPEIFGLSSRGLVPDAHHWLFRFNSVEGANWIHWANDEFDELTFAARFTPDPDQRAVYYREAESILLEEETGILPVCRAPRAYLAKPYLEPRFSVSFGLGPFHQWRGTKPPEQPPDPGGSIPPPDPGVSIPPTTKVADDETTNALLSISEDQAEFRFARMTGQLATLQPGDILVGDQVRPDLAPYGFLRRVIVVYASGDQVIVETEQGTLSEAIELGEVDVSVKLDRERIVSTSSRQGVRLAKVDLAPLPDGLSLKIDEVLYDDDKDPKTKNDQIHAKGSINLDPDLYFSLKIVDHELDYLEFAQTTTVRSRLELMTKVDIVSIREKVELAHYVFMPQTLWIGPLPVVITPELTVYVGLDGSVSVGITTSIEQEAALTSGVIYDEGEWTPFETYTNEFRHTPPTLTHNCSAKAYAGPEISLMIYGVAGPYGTLEGYLKLKADPGDTPWWKLSAGIEAKVGIKFKVLSRVLDGRMKGKWEETVIEYEEPLAQADEDVQDTPPQDPAGVTVTPTETVPDPPDKPKEECPSRWWPPRCWPWWAWVRSLLQTASP